MLIQVNGESFRFRKLLNLPVGPNNAETHFVNLIIIWTFLSGLSLIMVMLMMWSVWPLLIESALILLQTVPTHIDIDLLKRKLLESIDGILAVSKGKANCVIWGALFTTY